MDIKKQFLKMLAFACIFFQSSQLFPMGPVFNTVGVGLGTLVYHCRKSLYEQYMITRVILKDNKAVDWILQQDIDVNKNFFGRSVFFYCAHADNPAATVMMLGMGGDPNSIETNKDDNTMQTMLMSAARAMSVENVAMLVATGADSRVREQWSHMNVIQQIQAHTASDENEIVNLQNQGLQNAVQNLRADIQKQQEIKRLIENPELAEHKALMYITRAPVKNFYKARVLKRIYQHNNSAHVALLNYKLFDDQSALLHHCQQYGDIFEHISNIKGDGRLVRPEKRVTEQLTALAMEHLEPGITRRMDNALTKARELGHTTLAQALIKNGAGAR